MSNHHPLCPWMPNQCFRKSELPWISPEPVIEIRQKKTVLCILFSILRPCYTSQSSIKDWYFFLTYMASQQDQLFYFNNSFLGCGDVQNVEKYYFYIYLSFSSAIKSEKNNKLLFFLSPYDSTCSLDLKMVY